MKKASVSVVLTLFFLFTAGGLYARSWDDLKEKNEKIFGSEKETKYDINAFFIEKSAETWEDHYSFMCCWLLKFTNYPKYTSWKILPFYYGLESKIDERKLSSIPILLTYWETDVIETSSHTDGENLQKYKELVNFKISPLFFSQTKTSETLFGFPIIPLFFKSTNPSGGHTNIAWFIDYEWNKEENGEEPFKRFFVMPFLFYKPGNNGYTHILPPVFLYDRNESGNFLAVLPLFIKNTYHDETYSSSFLVSLLFGSSSFTDTSENDNTFWAPIIPLYYNSTNKLGGHRNILWLIDYAWSEEEGKRLLAFPVFWYSKKPEKLSLISPVFCKTANFTNETETDNRWWLPIIPFIYRSTDQFGGHTNIAWFIDYEWNKEENGEESFKRFFVMPFLFYKPGNNGYTHILPPVFLQDRNESGEFFSVLPLFIKNTYHDETYSSSFFVSLLFGRSSFTDASENDNTFWAPIIPLYYNSKNGKGSHTNLLWIFDWGRDESGNMKRLFVLPFAFHSFAENGYQFYFPFYFKPESESSEEGVAFSPLYYHRWSKNGDTKWLLIHYKSGDFDTGKKTNIWFPVYYNFETPENESLGQEKYHSTIIAPLYWRVNTARRDTTLFLPLYFETTKNDGSKSLYINILGYSKSILAGTNPVISAGGGMNQRGAYIDADASWLFDMVSVSTRLTIPLKGGEASSEATDTGVSISKVNNTGREDSQNFWGFHLFYGLLAYQKADSRNHFRLLPLWWVTWDKASSDKFKFILNYFSYKNEDTEYLVFFPLYAYQRNGDSFSKGYALNLYWHEYDSETEMTERTILWPVANWYSSPKNNGFRIIPFIRHRNIVQDDSSLYSSTYTPLYINRSVKSADDGSTLYRLNMSLLHFYEYKKETDSHLKLWFSSIPFIFNRENESITDNTNVIHKLKWILPLGVVKETEKAADGKIYSSGYRLWGLPFLYYRKNTRFDLNGDAVSQSSRFFLLGYQRKSGDISSDSFLFGLYESESDKLSQNYSYSLFYGLFSISKENERFRNYFLPVYYYGYDNEQREQSILMGLYRRKHCVSGNTESNTTSLFYYLFCRSKSTYSEKYREEGASSGETQETPKERITDEDRTWLIPLFYKTSLAHRDGSKNRQTSFSLLHYKDSETTLNGTSSTSFYPIIPLYYHSEDSQENHTNMFWLWDFAESQNSRRRWFVPFYFGKTSFSEEGTRGYRHILPPFYFSSWDEDKKITGKTILGFNFYDSPHAREENFLYIYRHYRTKNCEQCDEQYSFIFSLFKFEKRSNYESFRILGGFIADADWDNSGKYDLDALLYLTGINIHRDNLNHRVIPLWYYNRNKDSTLLVIPPILTWNSENSRDKFQLWGLGALWYRNYKADEHKDFQALLLGIPYYKVQKPERGYESWGSLWGLLWQYEKESETNFSKFSLLKILYKRTVMDGEVRHSVLGIKF